MGLEGLEATLSGRILFFMSGEMNSPAFLPPHSSFERRAINRRLLRIDLDVVLLLV